jgi:cytochrome b561
MQVKNSIDQYGIITKVFHWTLVLLIAIQFYLIIQARWLPENSPVAGFLIGGLHKPIGMLVFLIAILSYIWRLINIKPIFPPTMEAWEKLAATTVHNLLYLCLFVMPLSGLIMSVAGGRPPNFFGLFQVPQFLAENKNLSDFFFSIHRYTGYLLLGLIILHVLAALKHHFINRDHILKRMWF